MTQVTTTDGTTLYVKDWGEGRPVVLVHGWPLTCDTFDDLALTLVEEGFRAISYDRRGFGRSAQPWRGYDYDTLADDLAAVVRATGARDLALLGFSMGGGEVARYLSRHGAGDVRQAILVSSVVPSLLRSDANPGGVEPRVVDEIGRDIREDRADFFTRFFREFYGVGLLSHPVTDAVVDWSRAQAMQAGLRPTLACAEAFATTDFSADLAAFTMPTLVVHGTADRSVPIDATARRVAAALPHALLREYVDAPHGLLASHKDSLAADVLAFLRDEPLPEPVAIDLGVTLLPMDPKTA
jgi:pimeloyl-ACP methyl ester carboxylesterase